MENKDQPALPVVGINRHHDGLTKREYAIIHILAGMQADPNCTAAPEKQVEWAKKIADEALKS